MTKQISTGKAPGAPFLSQALVSDNLVFVSGQIHSGPDNALIGETTAEKVEQIMKNISSILEAAGAQLSDIVKVVIYVTDLSVMPELNKVYPSYFNAPFPVREAICVSALPLGAGIEISVIASKP
jgi:2-iminobutanoate/2-iminopropanoate deaminase